MTQWWALLSVLILAGCDILNGRRAYPVSITEEQQLEYYHELQRRLPVWFAAAGMETPQIPSSSALFAHVDLQEFRATPGSTCYFDPPRSIQIGDDKWHSGCVPHELGHAALYMIGSPAWCKFEHPGEENRTCRL